MRVVHDAKRLMPERESYMQKLIKTFTSRNPSDLDAKINEFFSNKENIMLALYPVVTAADTQTIIYTCVVTYQRMTKQDAFRNALRDIVK